MIGLRLSNERGKCRRKKFIVATPTVFSFTLQDNDNVKAPTPFYVSYDGAVETVDALIGTWLALGAKVDAVTGARILSGSVTIPLAADGTWKTTPLTGQSVSDTLNLSFANEDTINTDTFVVPAVRDTLISAGRPIVTAGGAIDQLAQLLIAGFTNGNYVNPSGSSLEAWIAAFQGVRKHRRQLKANSTVRP